MTWINCLLDVEHEDNFPALDAVWLLRVTVVDTFISTILRSPDNSQLDCFEYIYP